MKLSPEQRQLLNELNNSFNQSHEGSVWIDGFCNMLLHGHTSHEDDNTYDKEHKPEEYEEYKAGAKAGEEFASYLNKVEKASN